MSEQLPVQARPTGKPAFQDALAQLSPGYFALVMGTGILSIGLHDVGFDATSYFLLIFAAAAYVILWVLYIWRAVAHREAMRTDLRSPEKAFAYFTVIAGTGVLAVRLIQQDLVGVAAPLFILATVLWCVFGYLLPWQVFLLRDGRPILSRTNGTWFIWAVASQSVSIGMTQIQPHLGSWTNLTGIFAVLSWSVGIALYVGIAILVMLRVIHYGLTPQECEPTYWVAMGAMAIAVVAGSNIVGMESSPMVDATRALIAGTIAIFWGFCIWLIPLLVLAGGWKHFVHRIPFTYTPTLWSMVFPLGMFSVASIGLGRVDHLPAIEFLGNIMLAVSAAIWLIVCIAMFVRVIDVLRRTFGRRTLQTSH